MEGIALNLRLVARRAAAPGHGADEMVVVGGGSRSPLWRQIFADALEIEIVKTNVGQEAGSLGAAAVAAVACGLWRDFSPDRQVHQIESVLHPDPANVRRLPPAVCPYSGSSVQTWGGLATRSPRR